MFRVSVFQGILIYNWTLTSLDISMIHLETIATRQTVILFFNFSFSVFLQVVIILVPVVITLMTYLFAVHSETITMTQYFKREKSSKYEHK